MWKLPVLDQYEVCTVQDSAIDKEKSDLDKYQETLDRKHLKTMKGKKLTRFILQPMDTQQKVELSAITMESEHLHKENRAYEFAFVVAKATVARCWVDTIDGEKPEKDKEGRVTEEFFNRMSNPDLIFELAGYARNVAQLPLVNGEKEED